jgi:hypothetical protein
VSSISSRSLDNPSCESRYRIFQIKSMKLPPRVRAEIHAHDCTTLPGSQVGLCARICIVEHVKDTTERRMLAMYSCARPREPGRSNQGSAVHSRRGMIPRHGVCMPGWCLAGNYSPPTMAIRSHNSDHLGLAAQIPPRRRGKGLQPLVRAERRGGLSRTTIGQRLVFYPVSPPVKAESSSTKFDFPATSLIGVHSRPFAVKILPASHGVLQLSAFSAVKSSSPYSSTPSTPSMSPPPQSPLLPPATDHQPLPKYTQRSTCATPIGTPKIFLNPNPPNTLSPAHPSRDRPPTHFSVHIL